MADIVEDDGRHWLIRKDGYFYRPNRCGYTMEKAAAGRYTKAEADREAAIEPHNFTVLHESEVPDAPQVADLKAENAALRTSLRTAEARAEEVERETIDRCAKIAEEYPRRDPGEDGSAYWAAEEIATAIRATLKEPRHD